MTRFIPLLFVLGLTLAAGWYMWDVRNKSPYFQQLDVKRRCSALLYAVRNEPEESKRVWLSAKDCRTHARHLEQVRK